MSILQNVYTHICRESHGHLSRINKLRISLNVSVLANIQRYGKHSVHRLNHSTYPETYRTSQHHHR